MFTTPTYNIEGRVDTSPQNYSYIRYAQTADNGRGLIYPRDYKATSADDQTAGQYFLCWGHPDQLVGTSVSSTATLSLTMGQLEDEGLPREGIASVAQSISNNILTYLGHLGSLSSAEPPMLQMHSYPQKHRGGAETNTTYLKIDNTQVASIYHSPADITVHVATPDLLIPALDASLTASALSEEQKAELVTRTLSDLRESGIYAHPSVTRHDTGDNQIFSLGIEERMAAALRHYNLESYAA